MSKNIFSGLEDLGFNDIDNINLYKKEDKKADINNDKSLEENSEDKERSLLYDKEITCPVCGNIFKARSVKTSSYRVQKRDSDFFIRYYVINPYFYDVWLCTSCGYAAMKSDFTRIRSYQIDLIKQGITSKWHGRKYPDVYDINIAIERYKLSLLNYYVMEAKSSKKAMNCLKIAWMYRLMDDKALEETFLKQALEGFNDAYFNEAFPLYKMDKHTSMYLIGELNRMLGNFDEALKWFSQVITSPGVSTRVKDIARDQKDLIKREEVLDESTDNFNINENKKSKGFFSKFFK